MSTRLSDLEIASLFHYEYERLAPNYGYETREDTKHFEPTTPNGRLMAAVCGKIAEVIRLEERKRCADIAAKGGSFWASHTDRVCLEIKSKIISGG